MTLPRARRRIAILGTRGIPAAYGGFETFAEELAVRLAAAGVDVTVYCETGAVPQPAEYQGVRLRHLPATACGPLTTVLFDLRSLWDARRGYDVVYLLGYGAAQFSFIPRLFGSEVWLNVDGIEWMRAKWGRVARAYFKAMEFFSVKFPNRVIADAEGVRAHLLARHRRLPACSVIAYGAPVIETQPDSAHLAEWGLEPGRYYLVVCRLEPENHVREIIEGFAASKTALPLVIVGDHQTPTDYVRRLRRHASERTRFIGTIYDKPKLQALRYHALAYFHGHSVGGTNPSMLEAMGCGNLVIAHDNVFNREMLGSGGQFFRSAADIPELVAHIEGMSADESSDERNYMRDRVRSEYNWDRIAAAYLRLLDSAN